MPNFKLVDFLGLAFRDSIKESRLLTSHSSNSNSHYLTLRTSSIPVSFPLSIRTTSSLSRSLCLSVCLCPQCNLFTPRPIPVQCDLLFLIMSIPWMNRDLHCSHLASLSLSISLHSLYLPLSSLFLLHDIRRGERSNTNHNPGP